MTIKEKARQLLLEAPTKKSTIDSQELAQKVAQIIAAKNQRMNGNVKKSTGTYDTLPNRSDKLNNAKKSTDTYDTFPSRPNKLNNEIIRSDELKDRLGLSASVVNKINRAGNKQFYNEFKSICDKLGDNEIQNPIITFVNTYYEKNNELPGTQYLTAINNYYADGLLLKGDMRDKNSIIYNPNLKDNADRKFIIKAYYWLSENKDLKKLFRAYNESLSKNIENKTGKQLNEKTNSKIGNSDEKLIANWSEAVKKASYNQLNFNPINARTLNDLQKEILLIDKDKQDSAIRPVSDIKLIFSCLDDVSNLNQRSYENSYNNQNGKYSQRYKNTINNGVAEIRKAFKQNNIDLDLQKEIAKSLLDQVSKER